MRITDGLIRRDRNRIQNHPALRFLHLIDFSRLIGRRKHTVHDADSTLLRHRNGQSRLGYGVHGRADDGNIQLNVSRQASTGIDLAGEDL